MTGARIDTLCVGWNSPGGPYRQRGDSFGYLGTAHLSHPSVPSLIGFNDKFPPGFIHF